MSLALGLAVCAPARPHGCAVPLQYLLVGLGTGSRQNAGVLLRRQPRKTFAPSINTTGTSFDATEQIYDNIVKFERGGTQVVPGLAEKWTVSKDGLEYTFPCAKASSGTPTRISSPRVTSMQTTSYSPLNGSGGK